MVSRSVRILITATAIVFVWCVSSFADVTIGSGGFTTSKHLTTLSGYTVDTGSNRLLLMVASWEDNNATAATVSGITYGGISATRGPITLWYSASGRVFGLDVFYMKDADIPSGSNTMTVSWAGTGPPQTDETVLSICTFTGVDQTTPVTDSDSATAGNQLNITNSVTGMSGDMTVHFEVYGRGTGGSWTQNNSAVEGYDVISTGGSSMHGVGFKLNHSTPSATASGVSATRDIGMSTIVIGKSSGSVTTLPMRRRRIIHK